MQIKYVGLKEEETAFSSETGITWFPGSSHPVPDNLARRMLQHPDVFELDTPDEEEQPKTVVTLTPTGQKPLEPTGDAKPEFVMGTPDGPMVLDQLDRDALVELAKSVKVEHHVNLGAPKLRALLVEKFPLQAA